MPEQDRRLRRARAEWAAARACLRDRRAGVAAAESHLALAFAALLARGVELPARGELGALARAGSDAAWSASLAVLAADLDALGGAAQRPGGEGRRRARRLLRALARVVVQPRALARWRTPAVGLGAAVLALVLAWWVSAGTTGEVGFQARYFPRPDLAGRAVTRRDAHIDFTWLAHAPMAELPPDGFSVRWDGCFQLAEPERMTFRVGSDDGSRVWLDGKKIVDNWRDQGGNWMARTLSVEPGAHHVRVDYYERGGDAFVVFELSRGGTPVDERFVHPPASLEPEVRCDTR